MQTPKNDYLVISQDGLCFRVKPSEDISNLEFLQTIVGGLIERVPVQLDGADCFVNEEGLMKGFGHNITASIICNHLLVGPAVFAGFDGEGGTTPCPEMFITKLADQGLALEGGRDHSWELKDALKVIEQDTTGEYV